PARSSLPFRSPWRLSWKMVNRTGAWLSRKELRERRVERVEEAALGLVRLFHQPLLQIEGGLGPLHVVDGEARFDDRVEVVGVLLAGKRAQRNDAVLFLARVAGLRRRAGDARVERRPDRIHVAPRAQLLGLEAIVLGRGEARGVHGLQLHRLFRERDARGAEVE